MSSVQLSNNTALLPNEGVRSADLLNAAPLRSVKEVLQLVSVVASPAPILMLVTVVVLRYGFLTPINSLIKLAGVSLLVVNATAFGSARRWMFSGPVLSLIVLVAVSLVGLSRLGLYPAAGWIVGGVGLIFTLTNLFVVASRLGFIRGIALLVLGLALGTYAESMYWRSGGEHLIDYPEAIVGGLVHADVLQQTAIVDMIDTYGVPSTGLDGVVPMKYHTGSLWAAYALQRLCGFRALDFVAYGYGLLLVPFYIAGFFAAAAALRVAVQRGAETRPPLFFWIVCSVAFVGLFPFMADPNHWNFNETILNSDSLLFAYGLSMWLIAAAAIFYISAISRKGGILALTLAEKLSLSLGLPLALALGGFVKVSQIYLLLALLVYLSWRVRWLRVWPILLGAGISIAVAIAQLRGETGAVTVTIAPFNFDRLHPEWVPYFFIVYFLSAWVFLLLWARVRNVQTLADFTSAARSGQSIPVELVFVAVVAGLIPYLLVDFHSPIWKYFTEFHGVLAGAFIAAFVPGIDPSTLVAKLRTGQISVASTFGLILALAVCGHLFMTTEGATYRMVKSIGEARAAVAGTSPLDWRSQFLRRSRAPVSDLGVIARRNVLQCLQNLGAQPTELKRVAAIYIPKTNRVYWDMRQIGMGATPFLAPAESGVAMVLGLPEFEDIGWAATGWGYPQYKLPSGPELSVDQTQEAVLKARAGGFKVLWVFRGANQNGCDLERVELN